MDQFPRLGKRAYLSPIVYLYLCGFCSERFPLPLGAWDGLRYFIVALPVSSIYLFCMRGEALTRHFRGGLYSLILLDLDVLW